MTRPGLRAFPVWAGNHSAAVGGGLRPFRDERCDAFDSHAAVCGAFSQVSHERIYFDIQTGHR